MVVSAKGNVSQKMLLFLRGKKSKMEIIFSNRTQLQICDLNINSNLMLDLIQTTTTLKWYKLKNLNLKLSYLCLLERAIGHFDFAFLAKNLWSSSLAMARLWTWNRDWKQKGSYFRGTQWICSSKYLFFRQIFAGWEIWKKWRVLVRKVLLGNRLFREA